MLTPELHQGAVILDAMIEDRIDNALSLDVISKLALHGVSEAQARDALRRAAVRAILEGVTL
jgi:hypothetical protein